MKATVIAEGAERTFVRPILELVLSEAPTHLRKRHDPDSGLALIDLREEWVMTDRCDGRADRGWR